MVAELLIVTTKRQPGNSALFLNGEMVYYTRLPGQAPTVEAMAHSIAKGLGMDTKKQYARSVNLPVCAETRCLDGRTYLKGKKYLEYRDRSTANARLAQAG